MSMTGSRRDSDNLMKHEWTRGHGKPSSESVAGNQEAYRRRVIPCCPEVLDHPFFCLCVFVCCADFWSFLAKCHDQGWLCICQRRGMSFFCSLFQHSFWRAVFLKKVKARFLFLPGSTANSWVLRIQRWGEIGIIHCCEWLEATTRGLYFDNVLSLWF